MSAAVSDPHSTQPARSRMPSNKRSEDVTLRYAEKMNQKTECTHTRYREREGGAGGEGGTGGAVGGYHARTHNCAVVMLCRRLSPGLVALFVFRF